MSLQELRQDPASDSLEVCLMGQPNSCCCSRSMACSNSGIDGQTTWRECRSNGGDTVWDVWNKAERIWTRRGHGLGCSEQVTRNLDTAIRSGCSGTSPYWLQMRSVFYYRDMGMGPRFGHIFEINSNAVIVHIKAAIGWNVPEFSIKYFIKVVVVVGQQYSQK